MSPISSVTFPEMLNWSGLKNSSASSFTTPGCIARLLCSTGAVAAHQQCCSHTPPHFQALALPSGYWHLNLCICWLGEGMKQHFCSYEQNKRQHISNFSSGTQLPKFKSVNIVFLFLKILRVVSSSEKRKQTTNKTNQEAQTQEGKQKRREQVAQEESCW